MFLQRHFHATSCHVTITFKYFADAFVMLLVLELLASSAPVIAVEQLFSSPSTQPSINADARIRWLQQLTTHTNEIVRSV